MKFIDPKTVFGRRDLPWFDLLQIHVQREEFKQWLSSEPLVEWVDGLGEADYWIIGYDCGMWLSFEFVHAYDFGRVSSSEPNANHAIRHLLHWRQDTWVYPEDSFRREREWVLEQFSLSMPQLRQQSCCQLWRQGDDGNPVAIGYPTSEMDASCFKRELEARGHKQIYWVEHL